MEPVLHVDELAIDHVLVRQLVDRTLPQCTALPIERLDASGSSNALFRLGKEFLVRLPRQPGGSETIKKEQRWLPIVAPLLPVRVPEIVALGEPDFGYPECWSVVRWLPGEAPRPAPRGSSETSRARDLAVDLAHLVRAFRTIPVPAEAADNQRLRWYRGEPLASLDDEIRRNIEACRTIPDLRLDLDSVLGIWRESIELRGATASSAPHWYHGDLFAENLLVSQGRLSGVLDFGGLGVGDPTVDLLPAWEVLDPLAREDFRAVVGVADDTWRIGRAWALAIAVLTFPYYWTSMPERCASRAAIAQSVIDDVHMRD
jgi:aminoglycoside phosphotransferase (APT) family kinase protein